MTCFLRREQEIHARYAPWSQAVELFLFDRSGDQRRPIQFQATVISESISSEPSISLSEITAQRLMDQLWNCGFRPTEGTGSAGALAATQQHLADLRKIVFKELDIE
jgi:hypothetical protein